MDASKIGIVNVENLSAAELLNKREVFGKLLVEVSAGITGNFPLELFRDITESVIDSCQDESCQEITIDRTVAGLFILLSAFYGTVGAITTIDAELIKRSKKESE
jgi:hypothetical protein